MEGWAMERVLEPEIMDDPVQARAYADADFDEENQAFVDLFRRYFPEVIEGHLLDLGCGPADIAIRLARALADCRITGVDASEPMIQIGQQAVDRAGLADRITLRCERFQSLTMDNHFDAIISNSLLHHIKNPLKFWYAVTRLVKPGGCLLVMDLVRPESHEAAQAIVDRYASGEPPILRRDFYHSLCAAFTEDEVAAQLAEMNLTGVLIYVPDDRHWVAAGRLY
jgi:2-polyprenyl-3-methyl-5-hydroxy-6-metoxy-1,4-benzoquinol methylase